MAKYIDTEQENFSQSISENLKALLRDLGLTANGAEKMINARNILLNVSNGKNPPKSFIIRKLFDAIEREYGRRPSSNWFYDNIGPMYVNKAEIKAELQELSSQLSDIVKTLGKEVKSTSVDDDKPSARKTK